MSAKLLLYRFIVNYTNHKGERISFDVNAIDLAAAEKEAYVRRSNDIYQLLSIWRVKE